MDTEPCVDPASLDTLAQMGGKAFAAEMIDLFLNYAPQKLAEARAAEQSGDLLGVKKAVHPIKSSAGYIGARPMQALAARIEQLAGDQSRESIGAMLTELEATYVQVKSRLEQQREALTASGMENAT
ncbi:MAG: Hpt domain-containing protein [Kiritimatiellia bacterium]